jgi:hypothetical protein
VYAHTIGSEVGFDGDGNVASLALLNNPTGLWLTTSGVLYIADFFNNGIRKSFTTKLSMRNLFIVVHISS